MKLKYTFRTSTIFADVLGLVLGFANLKMLDGSPLKGMDYGIYNELEICFETKTSFTSDSVMPVDTYMQCEIKLIGADVYFEASNSHLSNGWQRQEILSPQLNDITTKLFVLYEKDKLCQLKLNKELVTSTTKKEL